MHGLVSRALQNFLLDTYGEALWNEVARAAGVPAGGFEALLCYDRALAEAVIERAAPALGKSRDTLLEDLGTYLVSHPNTEALRRLLRFGGVDFLDFMHSLDDLPGRARLAMPDIDLPEVETREQSPSDFLIICRWEMPGFGRVLAGILRAMADDYGALVLIEPAHGRRGEERLMVRLLDADYQEGRRFDLVVGRGA